MKRVIATGLKGGEEIVTEGQLAPDAWSARDDGRPSSGNIVNIAATLHPAARRDDAARHLDPDLRHRGLPRCCRSAICRRSTFRPSRSAPACRARARRRWRRRVATPLEKQFATIAGVTSIISSNSQGSTNITLQFDLNRSIDAARPGRAVDDLADARGRCRPTCRRRRRSSKVNPADSPVLFLTLSSDTLPLSDVDHYAETYSGQRLSMVVRRGAGQRLRRAEVCRCASTSTRASSRPGSSGSTRWRQAINAANVEPPDRDALRRTAQLRPADAGPADERRGLSTGGDCLSQRQP